MIDFPSNPTLGQQFTAAGLTWTWDGVKWVASGSGIAYLPLIGGTLSGDLTINGDTNTLTLNGPTSPANWAGIRLMSPTGQGNWIGAYINGNERWEIDLGNGIAEAAGNIGSNFQINRNANNGVFIDSPVIIQRSSGITFLTNLSAPQAVLPNRVDNGDMWVDQHNSGAPIVMPANSAAFCPDRWWFWNTQATSRYSVGQNYPATITAGPPGFRNWVGIQSSSAYTSAAASAFYVQHGIEADAISDLGQGVAGAQPFTISFWARSSLTGNFSLAIQGGGATARSYVTTYSLPTANTWTKIAITIPGDVAGGAWSVGSNAGMYLVFDFGSGTAVQTSTLNAWASNSLWVAAGAVHVTGTNNANWAITGVKLEAGSVATPFPVQDLATKWARCMRYYTSLSGRIISGWNNSGGAIYDTWEFPVVMRAVPTVAFPGVQYNNASGLAPNNIFQSAVVPVVFITDGTSVNCWAQTNVTASAEI